MPLSWNEIRSRSIEFVKEWEGESRERAEKDSFWNDFFNVFGISRRRVATFEEPVKKLSQNYGFIDLFWKGKLLIEHKSKGKDLNKAYTQAIDYFAGLKERDLPKYILVSDFDRFKLYDLDEKIDKSFSLHELPDNIQLFGFIAGYEKRVIRDEDPVNIEAAEKMGILHDKLKEVGYDGHQLEILLVRLLFCMFADDTGIFNRDIFRAYIDEHTKEDGSDLAMHLAQIFQIMDTPLKKRQSNLDEVLNEFPYVNGELFSEPIRLAYFDSSMREILLDAGALDWGEISPAIFGSMFQAAMNPKERRNLGAHYTSEKNILKVIKPLFLDDLWEEFEKIKNNDRLLSVFHDKIANLNFLDPACGSGNFLIITYRELRKLELEILRRLRKDGQAVLDVRMLLKVSISQFYGIEIDDFAAKVAEVAMWLIEHQLNEQLSLEFGQNVINLPLSGSVNVKGANALLIPWSELIGISSLDYILGNPPFIGAAMKNAAQKEDMQKVFGTAIAHGKLDYVSAWYYKGMLAITENRNLKLAFVSTNSVCQGEQVPLLWQILEREELEISFAHRTFEWTSEAKGKAAVHCIIIGISQPSPKIKQLYDYETVRSEAFKIDTPNITPYLTTGSSTLISKRSTPLSNVPKLVRGNIPYDDGHLLMTEMEKVEILNREPQLQQFVRKYGGAYEMLNNKWRYCFWLKDADLDLIKNSAILKSRIEEVLAFRKGAKSKSVKSKQSTPTLFGDIRQPHSDYLMIPRVSSHRRYYLPIAYEDSSTILADSAYGLPEATKVHFAILSSKMHNCWLRIVAGRLKSDYRYSATIVFNNFPFPKTLSQSQNQQLTSLATEILEIRSSYVEASLATLYDPTYMPPNLSKAHQKLDRVVDLTYSKRTFKTERERIEFLFKLYEEISAPLLS